MSDIGLPTLVAKFGREADRAASSDRLSLSGAIWSVKSSGCDELIGDASPEHHVVSVALSHYVCEPVVDGRRMGFVEWKPGLVQVMRAGVEPKGVFEGPWRMLHLYVPHLAMAEALEVAPGALEVIDPLGREDSQLATAGLGVAQAMVEAGPGARLCFEVAALAVVAQLGRRWSNLAAAAQPPSAKDWRLRRAIEFLEAHLADDVTLADIAATVGLSLPHLATLFRAGTGQPPHRWLMHRRVERACALLADRRTNITDIALACGFASSQHLAAVFRAQRGMTPSAYRRALHG